MAKVLITGVAGFIGSHLAHELVKQGNEVFGIDNLSTGREENLLGLPNDVLIKGDYSDSELLEPLMEECDVVYHLAASVGVKLVVDFPIEAIESNVTGIINVLRAANKYSKKIFIASSSEVYGKGDGRYLNEQDNLSLGNPKVLRWGYGCSKLMAEYLAMSYYKKEKLPVVIGRFFNICGPRQTGHYGMVVPRFIMSALENKPIVVYGDGSQTRSFTYIDDALNAIIKLMHEKHTDGEIFNIGNPKDITIQDLAILIKKVTGSSSPIVNVPYTDIYGNDFEDTHYRAPDISKITKAIGFKPKIDLEEMIKRTAEFWKGKIK
jgi:UDP-glucose 4-epimerase